MISNSVCNIRIWFACSLSMWILNRWIATALLFANWNKISAHLHGVTWNSHCVIIHMRSIVSFSAIHMWHQQIQKREYQPNSITSDQYTINWNCLNLRIAIFFLLQFSLDAFFFILSLFSQHVTDIKIRYSYSSLFPWQWHWQWHGLSFHFVPF